MPDKDVAIRERLGSVDFTARKDYGSVLGNEESVVIRVVDSTGAKKEFFSREEVDLMIQMFKDHIKLANFADNKL